MSVKVWYAWKNFYLLEFKRFGVPGRIFIFLNLFGDHVLVSVS
jgi:hypothetical protein